MKERIDLHNERGLAGGRLTHAETWENSDRLSV